MRIKDIVGKSKIRNFKICQLWLEGDLTIEQIAMRFGVVPSTISRIVYKNRHALTIDKQYEKVKRVRWLRAQIRKKKATRKDPAELQEQMRKEIEGDKPLVDQSQHYTVVWQIGDEDSIQTPQESGNRLAGQIEV